MIQIRVIYEVERASLNNQKWVIEWMNKWNEWRMNKFNTINNYFLLFYLVSEKKKV